MNSGQRHLNAEAMTGAEKRAAFSLAGIYSLRMLGLFMILPVFVLYAPHYAGYTPALAGLAIGIYGLTQAIFQIPLGMLSDRIGRKPVIVGGLVVFALGSMVAASADSMLLVIIGRALQGTGAIAAAIMALAADLTREEHRTKAMAVIGMSIGLSFAAALIIGPVINSWISVPGIFWVTAVLALLGIAVVVLVVPHPAISRFHRDTEVEPNAFRSVLVDTQLLRLDFGILVLHLILTATFVAIPVALRDELGVAATQHWQIYLGVLVAAVLSMVPFIIVAEKRRRMKEVFVGAVGLLLLVELALSSWSLGLLATIAVLWLFFTAFNFLEASLPSLVSKMAPPERKGTAMGIYSSTQFFGAFLGGTCGGWALQHYGVQGVFAMCAALALLWLVAAATMRAPRYLSSHLLNVGAMDASRAQALAQRLTQVAGVAEAVVIAEEGIAYLKVDRAALDHEALSSFSLAES